jgi:AraC-like DNA-binding protein
MPGINYQIYKPRADLAALIQCFWTLEVPAHAAITKQRIIPDGCIEMVFVLGDEIKRYTSDTAYIIQPRAFVLGQITKPFFVQPTGSVNSFAVRFYPYGFANFVSTPLKELANRETPLDEVFGAEQADELIRQVVQAQDTDARIRSVETFLVKRLESEAAISKIVQTTVAAILSTKGNISIKEALEDDRAKRRQLERKFLHQIGISPKQLGRVVRLQTALRMMLEPEPQSLSKVAYGSDYYDQAHFSKDFKEFTGTTPKEFFKDKEMELSALFYKH